MTSADLHDLARILPPERIVTSSERLESLSRDFYWYSPVLKRDLSDRLAEAVVQPTTRAEVVALASFAHGRRIPITLRGAGTGNYGQCIPTHGGLVMDLAALDTIHSISPDGVAHCDPAARLGAIERVARQSGWELRCYPSTYVKATVAGFCAGGSGGIGSIQWGALRENGTVHALSVLSLEAEPREVRLEGRDIFQVLHAWGTNGIILGVELRLAPRTDWGQVAVAFDGFASAYDFCEAISRNDSFRKRLATVFEWPLPGSFTPLQKWVPQGKALCFFEVADDQLQRLADAARNAGGDPCFIAPFTEPRRGAQLSDYTWNHTTLWALRQDPSLTYLQCGFSPTEARSQFRALKGRYGGDFLLHIEFVRSGGVITPGAIPVVRYTDDARLQEMIDFCGGIGVSVANPHVNFLEGSGRWRPDDAKRLAKERYDPLGLLNPGKMRDFKAANDSSKPARAMAA
ncbi:MAG: FAD-binding oxidoreductase [Verrucomicrobiota bacterium]